MPQVEPDCKQRDHATEGHPPHMETVDDPLVRTGGGAGVNGVPGQVEQVLDEEQRVDHTTPAQGERGVG